MEEVCRKGLTKAIGVSNFSSKQLETIRSFNSSNNQSSRVSSLLEPNEAASVLYGSRNNSPSYFPLGSRKRPWRRDGEPDVLSDPKILAIAEKRAKSPAQIFLRWNYQLGNVVLFKTRSKQRLMENKEIFEFQLTSEEMDELESLDFSYRLCKIEWNKHFAEYPFKTEVEF